MGAMASQISGVSTVEPFVQTQIKENIKAPRHWPLWGEFPVKGPVTRKLFPFDDVIVNICPGWRETKARCINWMQGNTVAYYLTCVWGRYSHHYHWTCCGCHPKNGPHLICRTSKEVSIAVIRKNNDRVYRKWSTEYLIQLNFKILWINIHGFKTSSF